MGKYIRHWDRTTLSQKIDDGSFLSYMITEDTHLNKHTHNTESQNLDRIILERKAAQGLFMDNHDSTNNFDDNYDHAMAMIDDAIYSKKNEVIDWMMNATDGEKQGFHMTFIKGKDDIVGTGVIFDRSNNTIKEYETSHLTFVLKRDMLQPNGFYLVTAYPDLEHHDIEPTGRDLTPFIKESQAYKNGDDVYRTYLRYITDVNNHHLVTYKEGYTPEDSMMMIRMNTENPDIYHEIKIKQNKMTLRTIENNYDANGHLTDRKTLHTDYNDVYETATGQTDTRYVDFNNEKVFQKFVKEYPDMKIPLTNIRIHFANNRLPEPSMPHFDATRSMSNFGPENSTNYTKNGSKTAPNVPNSSHNADKAGGNVQQATSKCPTPPAHRSTTKLERIANTSTASPEDENELE